MHSYQFEQKSTYFLSIFWIEVWHEWVWKIIWETHISYFTTIIVNCGPLYCYFSKVISSLVSHCKALKSNMCTNQKLVLWSNAIILREQGKREIRISMWEKTKQSIFNSWIKRNNIGVHKIIDYHIFSKEPNPLLMSFKFVKPFEWMGCQRCCF